MDQYATLLHGIVRVSVVFGGMSDERNLPAESQRSNREANRAARVRTFCEMDDLGLTSRYSNRLVFGQRMDFAIRVQGRVIPVDFITSILLVIMIGIITVIRQSWYAATLNPIDTLKTE